MLTWKEMLQRAPRRSVTVADAAGRDVSIRASNAVRGAIGVGAGGACGERYDGTDKTTTNVNVGEIKLRVWWAMSYYVNLPAAHAHIITLHSLPCHCMSANPGFPRCQF
jgi:hypothetical protein